MTLPIRPLSNFITILNLILCQISLAVALPTNNDLRVRAVSAPDISGAAGKIGGAAFGLILLSLGFGIGAASIAIAGSIEWREFRDRKKPDTEAAPGTEKVLQKVETGDSDDTVMKEKASRSVKTSPIRKPRLTLKSFRPMDFRNLGVVSPKGPTKT